MFFNILNINIRKTLNMRCTFKYFIICFVIEKYKFKQNKNNQNKFLMYLQNCLQFIKTINFNTKLAVILSIVATVKCSNDVSITHHPVAKSVMLGSSVTIPCRIENLPSNTKIDWEKNGFILGDVRPGTNYFESVFTSLFLNKE